MSDWKEQNQPRDYFSQYIQQQLKGHQLPPDESCWDEIGQQLKRRRNRLFFRRGLYIAGAAVFALLLLISIPVNKDIHPGQSEDIKELAISDVEIEKQIDNPVIAIADLRPLRQSPVETLTEEDNLEEVIVIVSENKPETKAETENEKEIDKPVVNEKKNAELPVLSDLKVFMPHKTRKKKNWQISAGLLAMGNDFSGSGINRNNYDFANDPSSIWIPSPGDYNNIQVQPDNCEDISYNVPLSFGITARKELGRRISVETGLVYTYLSTNLRRNKPNLIKGKLGLHYLGIPVNLVVALWDNSKWDVYASAGVMVEKGLRSVYTQQIHQTSTDEEATVKTSISGLQWSLNGSFGISYHLLKDWSLYVEPKVSYFFDNNQPISVRIDKPLTLGFGFGVRFDF